MEPVGWAWVLSCKSKGLCRLCGGQIIIMGPVLSVMRTHVHPIGHEGLVGRRDHVGPVL